MGTFHDEQRQSTVPDDLQHAPRQSVFGFGWLLPITGYDHIRRLAGKLSPEPFDSIHLDLDHAVKVGRITSTRVATPSRVAEFTSMATTHVGMCRVLAPEPGTIDVLVHVDYFFDLIFMKLKRHLKIFIQIKGYMMWYEFTRIITNIYCY